MKIETVREKFDDEMRDPIKWLIDDGHAVRYLSSAMGDDLVIEGVLRIRPDLDLMAEYVSETYRKNNELSESENEELQDALRETMPIIHRNLTEPSWAWSIPPYFKNEINWKEIKKLLPKSFESGFSIDPIIAYSTDYTMITALRIVELYLKSGMMLLSILSESDEAESSTRQTDLFRKIVITNMILESPGQFRWKIRRLSNTEDLVEKCMSLLNARYGCDLTIGPVLGHDGQAANSSSRTPSASDRSIVFSIPWPRLRPWAEWRSGSSRTSAKSTRICFSISTWTILKRS